MPIHMDSVHCSGGELNLLGCSYDRNTTNSTHSEDVGVKCRKCKLLLHISLFPITVYAKCKGYLIMQKLFYFIMIMHQSEVARLFLIIGNDNIIFRACKTYLSAISRIFCE